MSASKNLLLQGLTEDDLVEYIQTPEGRVLWLSILAKIPGIETMATEEAAAFVLEAIRQYTRKRSQ